MAEMVEIFGIQCGDGRVFGLPDGGASPGRSTVPPLFAREDEAKAWIDARRFLPVFGDARPVVLTVLVGMRFDGVVPA